MFQKSLLTDGGVGQIAEALAVILERIGIMCQNREMLEALERWGARVDHSAQIASFPPKLTARFAEELRWEFARSSADDAPRFGGTEPPGVGTQVAQFFHDYPTGERRRGNKRDFVYMAKLGDMLHRDDGIGHSLLLTDVPPIVEPLEAAMLLAEYAHRPGPAFAWNVRQVDYLIEMGEILGIKDWFSLGAICFAHPLRFDRDVADRLAMMARLGHNIGLTSMAVSGATAPVTVAGYVAMAAAEIVATWIVGRALNPKVGLGGSMWAGTLDMRTGSVSYSNPDSMYRVFAVVEFLRRWTGITISASCGEYCDCRAPGMYAALEKAYKSMTIAAFTGSHPGVGQGMFDNGKTICPAQLILERELVESLGFLGGAVEVTPETLALDTMLEIGFGTKRYYLDSDHTFGHFRDALWCPQIIDRSGWKGAESERETMLKCQAKADALVAGHEMPKVDPGKLAAMRKVVERAARELQ
ncbi:MAG TPA: trimethylamine methyltransferase family protein [Candidatus Brocadiia bacterium]|nr:trimethylamine methyltransferase family protein [Candidatus Brocadiia bacterium]